MATNFSAMLMSLPLSFRGAIATRNRLSLLVTLYLCHFETPSSGRNLLFSAIKQIPRYARNDKSQENEKSQQKEPRSFRLLRDRMAVICGISPGHVVLQLALDVIQQPTGSKAEQLLSHPRQAELFF